MWLCGPGDERGEPEFEWFGAGEEDVDAACEALMGEERWPVFRIPFGDGHTVVVVDGNHPDDGGNLYFVTHPEWGGRQGHLATISPHHQAGPGLSWGELIRIAANPDLTAPGIHDPDVRLLLLLPILGDVALPSDAANMVSSALARTGMQADNASRVAEMILWNPIWEPAQWEFRARSPLSGGEHEFQGLLECTVAGSPRFGVQLAEGITREQSDRLAQALGTCSP
ncbi:hypothetical protein [Streptomyces goshikiensis]|uniref:hypothetical protein n=1 Tax=Streptomyces goshikiensis TaxID=1942 RepID=UPI003714125C